MNHHNRCNRRQKSMRVDSFCNSMSASVPDTPNYHYPMGSGQTDQHLVTQVARLEGEVAGLKQGLIMLRDWLWHEEPPQEEKPKKLTTLLDAIWNKESIKKLTPETQEQLWLQLSDCLASAKLILMQMQNTNRGHKDTRLGQLLEKTLLDCVNAIDKTQHIAGHLNPVRLREMIDMEEQIGRQEMEREDEYKRMQSFGCGIPTPAQTLVRIRSMDAAKDEKKAKP